MRHYHTQDTLEAIAEALGTEPASLLMRDPAKGEDSLWLIWDRASESERRQIEAVAAALKRTGT